MEMHGQPRFFLMESNSRLQREIGEIWKVDINEKLIGFDPDNGLASPNRPGWK
jgi:hypothetical protein